jgi:hypothetical protein
MQWLATEDWWTLFSDTEQDAFHLELRDAYGVHGESSRFREWLNGGPETFDEVAEWFKDWTDEVQAATRAGKTIRRLRVVTEPLSDYIRFEHHDTIHNVTSGEDIRWLPRQDLPDGIVFPHGGLDHWLLDHKIVVFNHFHPDGRSAGRERVADADIVAQCVQVRDALWPLGIPHDEYKPAL